MHGTASCTVRQTPRGRAGFHRLRCPPPLPCDARTTERRAIGEAAGIPEATRRFIAAHISSVEQLEVLLLLRCDADRWWPPEEVAGELSTPPDSVAHRLRDLRGHGLVAEERSGRDGTSRFRYQPATPELEGAVSTLAQVYARRRSSVISVIFADPDRSIRTFADAFRLSRPREEPEDG